MTRNEALKIARTNRQRYIAATIEFDFGRSSVEPKDEDFGHKHGWFRVGNFNFSTEEITGQPYDMTQGNWAFL